MWRLLQGKRIINKQIIVWYIVLYLFIFVYSSMKKEPTIGFANMAVARRKIKEDFFTK